MREHKHSSYLLTSDVDRQWGMVVSSVGMQDIDAGASYPPVEHPTRYLFSPSSGRVLSEFQILYIVSGSGIFCSESTGRQNVRVKAGDMFLLFPGEWHSYHPVKSSGWKEYWIGFSGEIPQRWLEQGFVSPLSPVFHVGVKPELMSSYEQAIEVADNQESGFQQMLSSLAISILTTAVFYDRNTRYREESVDSLFQTIRLTISRKLSTVTPVSLAEDLGIGYSKFRKMFKDYTTMSPGKYILEMKMSRAKELLTNTDMLVQEISWELGFDNSDYFVTQFKHHSGLKPSDYRRMTRQNTV